MRLTLLNPFLLPGYVETLPPGMQGVAWPAVRLYRRVAVTLLATPATLLLTGQPRLAAISVAGLLSAALLGAALPSQACQAAENLRAAAQKPAAWLTASLIYPAMSLTCWLLAPHVHLDGLFAQAGLLTSALLTTQAASLIPASIQSLQEPSDHA